MSLYEAFRTIHLLAFFRDLERTGDGYAVWGAPGWATASEVEAALDMPCSGATLARLARDGELIRAEVRLAGAKSLVSAYRVPDSIARLTAELESRPHVAVVNPQDYATVDAAPSSRGPITRQSVRPSRGRCALAPSGEKRSGAGRGLAHDQS